MHLEASIFDMDGLLVDSEVLWHDAELEVFGALGVDVDSAGRSTKGMYVEEVVAYWHGVRPWAGPTQSDVVASLLRGVGERVRARGRLLPGAERALDLARERGSVGLASSTPMPLILEILDHFSLRDRFDVVRSADVEPYGKPHPAVFLSAATDLGVDPRRCLVFEDSAAGVLAARAARMSVIAVPDPADKTRPEFALADVVLGSLEELASDWLDDHFIAERRSR